MSRKPAFWIVCALLSLLATIDRQPPFRQRVSAGSTPPDGPRPGSGAGPGARGAAPPRTGGLSPGGDLRRGRGGADVRGAEAGGKDAFARMIRDGRYAPVHVARAALPRARSQRDVGPLHSGRRRVRVRGAAARNAPGARLAPAEARGVAERGAASLARRPIRVRPRRTGPGREARPSHRSHSRLRKARSPGRWTFPSPAGGCGRSPGGGDAVCPRAGGVRAAVPADALGQRGDRVRFRHRDARALRSRRHRHRPVRAPAAAVGPLAPRAGLGADRLGPAGAGHAQRMAPRVAAVRHGAVDDDIPGAAGHGPHGWGGGDDRRLHAVLHGGREPVAARLSGAPPVVARVGAERRSITRCARTHARRVSAGRNLLRVRGGAVPGRFTLARVVDPLRCAGASRRARDLHAVAVGHRTIGAGRVLGRVPVPRGAARRRRLDRRPLRQAAGLHRGSDDRTGHRVRRGARAVSQSAGCTRVRWN